MVRCTHAPLWLGVVIVVLVVACTGREDMEGSTRPSIPPSIELADCESGGVQARCGTVSVVEDRAAMTGRLIDLDVVVMPAMSEDHEPDPIFFLSGGPGGAATEDGVGDVGLLRETLRTRDLVMVDQRGTGTSSAVFCERPLDPDQWEAESDEVATYLAESPADVGAYTTAWAVDDFEEVRAALGYESVNLFGASYGATTAQVYAQRHQDSVRSAFLMFGTLLDVPIFERFPWASQRSLDIVFDRCAASSRCSEAFPDPAGDLDVVMTRLEQEPVDIEAPDGETFTLSRGQLAVGLHQLLTDTTNAGSVPWLASTAAQGDWDAVMDQTSDLFGSEGDDPGWLAMNLTILCHEPWARLEEATTQRWADDSYLAYPEVRMLVVPEEICAAVPPPDPAALYETPSEVPVPVLAVSAEADSQNPPENMADIGTNYPNGRVVVLPGQSHQDITISAATCLGGMLTSFFATASVDGVQADCVESVRPDVLHVPSN